MEEKGGGKVKKREVESGGLIEGKRRGGKGRTYREIKIWEKILERTELE